MLHHLECLWQHYGTDEIEVDMQELSMAKWVSREEKRSGIRGEVKEIGWGNQIRSYVMQPYTMVKDHRTNVEVTDVNKVLDGYIDPFINGYLKWINTGNEES